jgi:hypothetical protein
MGTTDRPSGAARDVLSALPHTRPTRRSAKRDATRGGPARGDETARPKVPAAGYATPEPAEPPDALRGGALVTTAVEAVGELAQVGVTLGVHGLRSALRRLPRP